MSRDTQVFLSLCGVLAFVMALVIAILEYGAPILSRKWRASWRQRRNIYNRECELIERGYSADEAKRIAQLEHTEATRETTKTLIAEGLKESKVLRSW